MRRASCFLRETGSSWLHPAAAPRLLTLLCCIVWRQLFRRVARPASSPQPLPLCCRYEDGDKEHLTEEELQECLVDRAAVLRKRREVLAAAAAAAHAGENDENDEAVAAAAQHARQLMVGVLGDATERRRNAAGHERRSRWARRGSVLPPLPACVRAGCWAALVCNRQQLAYAGCLAQLGAGFCRPACTTAPPPPLVNAPQA